jgi:hypothetical protein
MDLVQDMRDWVCFSLHLIIAMSVLVVKWTRGGGGMSSEMIAEWTKQFNNVAAAGLFPVSPSLTKLQGEHETAPQ